MTDSIHIIVTCIIAISANWFGFNQVNSITIAAAIGFLKELYDLILQNEFISLLDIGYDLLGIMIFLFLVKIKEKCSQ